MRLLTLCFAIAAVIGSACSVDEGTTVADGLGPFAADLIEAHGLASVAFAVIRDGRVVHASGHGLADVAGGIPATADTIYSLASCSKPVVGLAAALMLEDADDFTLDEDVADWLDWTQPLAHPQFGATPVTLRHLLTHRGGIATDGPADYDTYPKPDPDQALGPFLETLLADPDYWLDTAPGAAEEYSNLGVALAGLVVEAVADTDLRAFTEQRIFGPLGMPDTRWFFGDLSASQQARHALPHDEVGEAYEIYAFNDYPSGLLRTTVRDFARLMIVLAEGGQLDGAQVLSASAIAAFEALPMLIEPDDDGDVRRFEHSGGETGVNTYFTYGADGLGYVYLINSDLDDDTLETVHDQLNARLMAEARRP